ncbi:hypothetical protein XENORESO_009192, partial [Xenotaenia resolanae]
DEFGRPSTTSCLLGRFLLIDICLMERNSSLDHKEPNGDERATAGTRIPADDKRRDQRRNRTSTN